MYFLVPMDEKLPFVEDGSQFGVTRARFRKMRKAEKRELMVQWFHQHFDHPDNVGTPWVDHEYLWIWGGPYDAKEQLYAKFQGVANETLIDEVVAEVESEGVTDWGRHYIPDGEYEKAETTEIASLDQFSDEPSLDYGSPAERDSRAAAIRALDVLQSRLDEIPVGIGHNRPPEETDPEDNIELVRAATTALRVELAKPNPAISRVKSWARPLRGALIAGGKWAFATFSTLVAADIYAQHQQALHDAFNAIIQWLHIATTRIF